MNPLPTDYYRIHRQAFDRYQALLLKWNKKINLTSITEAEDIVERHFIDSLVPLEPLSRWFAALGPKNVSRETLAPSLLDIGSGAGFPGLPMKIAVPTLTVTLVDSVKKKCDFLKEVIRSLGLTGISVEHLTLAGQSIGTFDIIITRATLALRDYLEIAVPNLKTGGIVVAMKGLGVEKELEESADLLGSMGLGPWESHDYELRDSRVRRQIFMSRSLK